MQAIVPPIEPGKTGAEAGNLVEAILFLIKEKVVRAQTSPDQPTAVTLKRLVAAARDEQSQLVYGEASQSLMKYFQVQQGLGDNLAGVVEEKTAARLNEILIEHGGIEKPEPPRDRVVTGHVRQAGQAILAARIEVDDVDMRDRRRSLGHTKTILEGSYELRYSANQLCRTDKPGANLQVRALDASGNLLAESQVIFNARPEETVDLEVAGDRGLLSEYGRLVATLTPILCDVARHTLTDADARFLAAQTGFDPQYITWLGDSARCRIETDAIAESVFYGLFRQNLPTSLDELLDRDMATLREMLERSGRSGVIAALSDAELEDVMKRLQAVKAHRSLKPAEANRPSSLGDLLNTSRVKPEKYLAVAGLYLEHGGDSSEFWQALAENPEFSEKDVDAIRFTLHLDGLTKRHLPLVLELQQRATAGADRPAKRGGRAETSVRQQTPSTESPIEDLRMFAAFDIEDWKAILQAPQSNGEPIGVPATTAGANDEERLNNYATTLNEHIENQLPTVVIARRLAKDRGNDNPFKAVEADLQVFFDNNPAFDFRAAPVDLFLNDRLDQKLKGVADPGALTTKLRSIQRVFNVTPRYGDIRTLLADDLHSGMSIVHVGPRTFVERYAGPLGGSSRARDIFRKAEQVHNTALTLFLRHSRASRQPLPYAMGGDAPDRAAAPGETTPADSPEWSRLFGSIDLCDCEHCKSLYSPAAYFVDVLRFLDDGPPKDNKSPLEVLLERRPDLEHIELTCENTLTQLPYVDLAKEILEAAVVAREFEIAEGTDIAVVLSALRNGQLPAGFPAEFAGKGFPLTDKASVRSDRTGRTTDPSAWIVLDTAWAFSITHQGTFEGFRVKAWPQTSWTAADLRASPEHTHEQAYDALRTAVYPWNLPLNLPVEEVRTYLRHLGVPRHELMATFFRGAPANASSDVSIATDYVGLTPEAARVIAFDPADPTPLPSAWDCWGLQEANNQIADPTDGTAPPAIGAWDVVLRRVSIFLRQSGLRYDELLELLGTHFVNPPSGSKRTFEIVAAADQDPATCAPSKLEIAVVNQAMTKAAQKTALIAAWNRIHRFVRLWRALSWTARDLDKAITAFKPLTIGQPDITPAFLVQLSHVERFRIQLRLPVATLLSWWADIDTHAYIDHLKEDAPPVPSLYTTLFSSVTASGQSLPADPAALGGLISDNVAAITAALQLSAQDFVLLREDPNVIPRVFLAGTLDDRLTLGNLSRLHRHASLARALKLSVQSYLSTLEMVARDPFVSTAATVEYLRHIDVIHASGCSVEDLDYLLRHQFKPSSRVATTDKEIASLLDEIRAELRTIASEHAFVDAATDPDTATTDPGGDLTRQKLALLNWDTAVIDQVAAALNDTFTYAADLAAMAPTIVIPESLRDRLSYDAVARQLRFVGTMTPAERTLLTTLPAAGGTFRAAVTALFDAPKRIVSRHMARYSVPTFDAPLNPLPANFRIPEALKGKCFYDSVKLRLKFVGLMTEAERSALRKVSAEAAYLTVIDTLFLAPTIPAGAPARADVFLTSTGNGNDVDALFDDPAPPPQARFVMVLKKLLPHLRTSLGERAITQRLAEAVQLDASAMNALLSRWLNSSMQPTSRAITDFMAPEFAESNPNITSTREAFPDQFRTVALLHKVSVLCLRLIFTAEQLEWLFKFGAGNWLDVRALPLSPIGASHVRYQGWARLAELCRLRDALPQGERLLTEVFTKASAAGTQLADLFELLRAGAAWGVADLQALCSAGGFNVGVDTFKGESALLRLSKAVAALKRLGASATACLTWTAAAQTDAEGRAAARDIRSLVKAKFDTAQWHDLAKTLHDPLRERQRSALVSHLVARKGLRSAAELYEELLIDVEMSPCMMTTRVKQAICTVQLFVQRSLMNVEEHVAMSPAEAREWSQWRKQYRIWEANRKVLLYPENWIEPELRDNKSSFYEDLENELLQNDVTAASAEDAFLHYLEKLDQVSRLDIVGMYRQVENYEPEILHVVGRTHATPHLHFYRRLKAGVWSAWERVDLDIDGDHVMPVVWNRRLHLFWAIFTEKSDPPTKDQRDRDEDPKKYWEIKCAWSQLRNGKWMPKKISKGFLRHDKHPSPKVLQDPQHFSFKTRFQQGPVGDQLSIECYGPRATDVPPVTVTTQITTNTERVVDFYRHNDVFGNVAAYQMAVRFQVDQTPPRPQDLGKMRVDVRRALDDVLLTSLSLNGNGETNQSGVNPLVTQDVYCELVSGAFAVRTVSSKWEWLGFPGGLGVTVELIPWAPPPATTTVVSTFPPRVDLMQGLGEFTQDDANGNVVAVPVAEAYRPLTPPSLLAIKGTKVESMALVEDQSSTGALGNMAILQQTPGRAFRLLQAHQNYTGINFSFPLFFQDDRRTYLVSWMAPTAQSPQKVRFSSFFHPRVPEFVRALNRVGIKGLLTLANQRLTDSPLEFAKYQPGPLVDNRWPQEDVEFGNGGAYALYNWELFFHTPFLIALQLGRNQRFEEAQKWFHYIFDPTSTDSPEQQDHPGPERFWRVKPFYEEALRGVSTLEELVRDSTELSEQVEAWRADPFKPHVIARLRIAAYMKAIVMRYIDNLVAWGDQLFRRDTIESINEATQLYVLAGQILGKRPEHIRPRLTPMAQTFRTLDDLGRLDSLSNSVVNVEGFLAPMSTSTLADDTWDAPSGAPLTMPFFCLTGNDKLIGYWETVADRLFKIRHCMNIDGVVRSLPMFEPPIDPALLVRAAAAGVDLASVLGDINAPVPHYRFSVMLQKASELCNEVKALGGALLAALEKRDAEALALLRSSHEVELLKAVRAVKEKQVDEAAHTLQGLMKFQTLVTARQEYYQSRPFLNPFEKIHLGLTTTSLTLMGMQVGAEILAGILHLIPGLKMGAPTTIGATYGGYNVGPAAQAFGSAAGTSASILNTAASLSATLGSHQRRQDDWTHQADLATKELEQVKKQIAAAEVRSAIAERDLQNHDLQVESTKAAHAYMRDKFTNQELYSWMVGQISGIYFQSYQLAYDVAKRAERTYRYELGLKESSFVEFGYWDSLKKGLLAGERLHHDLRRMDVAYLDQNKREYEITKHVSLNVLDPVSVLKLKQTGECFVNLPEAIFDLDYPGHYLRRIKSVSVTIPCVAGPYASVNCTLTQHNSAIRHMSTLLDDEYGRQGDDDPRFTDAIGAVQAIVTSGGQNDSGLFEPNLRDDRYLPFEGKGVIGVWRIELPKDFPAFDHDTISDVVLHLRYTAREGGDRLRDQARKELSAAVDAAVQSAEQQGLARCFSLRHEFPSEWHRFLNPPAGLVGDQSMRVSIDKARFPFLLQAKPITMRNLRLFAKVKAEFIVDYVDKGTLNLSMQAGSEGSTTPLLLELWKGLVLAKLEAVGPLGDWTLAGWLDLNPDPDPSKSVHTRLDPEAIEDIAIVCSYTVAGT